MAVCGGNVSPSQPLYKRTCTQCHMCTMYLIVLYIHVYTHNCRKRRTRSNIGNCRNFDCAVCNFIVDNYYNNLCCLDEEAEIQVCCYVRHSLSIVLSWVHNTTPGLALRCISRASKLVATHWNARIDSDPISAFPCVAFMCLEHNVFANQPLCKNMRLKWPVLIIILTSLTKLLCLYLAQPQTADVHTYIFIM